MQVTFGDLQNQLPGTEAHLQGGIFMGMRIRTNVASLTAQRFTGENNEAHKSHTRNCHPVTGSTALRMMLPD